MRNDKLLPMIVTLVSLLLTMMLPAEARTNGSAKIPYPGGKHYMYRLTLTDKLPSIHMMSNPLSFLSQRHWRDAADRESAWTRSMCRGAAVCGRGGEAAGDEGGEPQPLEQHHCGAHQGRRSHRASLPVALRQRCQDGVGVAGFHRGESAAPQIPHRDRAARHLYTRFPRSGAAAAGDGGRSEAP